MGDSGIEVFKVVVFLFFRYMKPAGEWYITLIYLSG